MTNISVVVGAQFGSEGKGAVTAYLARELGLQANDVVIRVAGPNAGHTAYDSDGRRWALRAVPVAAVTNPLCQLHIGAGSEVDLDVLLGEITALDEAGHGVTDRLTVHPSATLLEARHRDTESEAGLIARVGSTGKGIGAARADRIMRRASVFGDLGSPWESEPGPFDLTGVDQVIIEGTQGYGLGLHTSHYPQVTSSDCRAIDFLAMAGISPWANRTHLDVWLVARVYPIRVAGNSGRLKNETTWEDLGLPEERTTVTQKIRRVGAWDQALVEEAIVANGGGDFHPDVHLALTMVDQAYPDLANQTELTDEAEKYVANLESELGCFIELVGTGPQTLVTR